MIKKYNAYDVTVVRSNRKTMGIEIKNGQLIVRVPRDVSDSEIQRMLKAKQQWIDQHLAMVQNQTPVKKLTEKELQILADQAREVIPEKVKAYARIMEVDYGRITIRNQKTRWGSCSSKGNLNFNCLLMLTPDEVIDSVVVHELCHRKHMNHSKAFYDEIKKVFPDYDRCRKWLREHGHDIMRKNPIV